MQRMPRKMYTTKNSTEFIANYRNTVSRQIIPRKKPDGSEAILIFIRNIEYEAHKHNFTGSDITFMISLPRRQLDSYTSRRDCYFLQQNRELFFPIYPKQAISVKVDAFFHIKMSKKSHCRWHCCKCQKNIIFSSWCFRTAIYNFFPIHVAEQAT